jgi:putative DNA primase/helicase
MRLRPRSVEWELAIFRFHIRVGRSRVVQPLIEYEREERDRIAPERVNAVRERKTNEAQIERLRKQVVSDSDEGAKTQLLALEQSLTEIQEFPRYWTQDCTPEALAILTTKNSERMAVLSDEGGYLDILGGRYSRGIANLDFVLQAHAGAPVRVDCKSGDTTYLAKPLLTIGLSPQPAVLSGLSDIPGFRGRGLLARFMYGLPPSNLGVANIIHSQYLSAFGRNGTF